MVSFVREYRNVGYAAKSIGKGIHGALLHMIDDAEPWIEIDGMLFVSPPMLGESVSDLVNRGGAKPTTAGSSRLPAERCSASLVVASVCLGTLSRGRMHTARSASLLWCNEAVICEAMAAC